LKKNNAEYYKLIPTSCC